MRELNIQIKNFVIYRLHFPSGKSYIGQTQNFEKRMSDYKRGGHKSQTKVFRALLKYGWNSVEVSIIHQTDNPLQIDHLETHFIQELYCVKNGYNVCAFGGSSRGVVRSNETKERLRIRAENQWKIPKYRQDILSKLSSPGATEKRTKTYETKKAITKENNFRKRKPKIRIVVVHPNDVITKTTNLSETCRKLGLNCGVMNMILNERKIKARNGYVITVHRGYRVFYDYDVLFKEELDQTLCSKT